MLKKASDTTLCPPKKLHPFIVVISLTYIIRSCRFFGKKHTPGNLEQTQMHRQPHLVSYVRTVLCKI